MDPAILVSNVPWWRALECIYARGGRQEEYFPHLSNFPPSPKLNWYSYNTRLDSVHSKPLGSDSLGYVLHPENLMERTFKAGDCTYCEQSIKCITCHNLTQLFCACWSGTNLKMKLETVDRILMSRETTVVDPGGGTRGSGPPPIRPDVCSKIFIVFWCPPMICSPLLAKKYFPRQWRPVFADSPLWTKTHQSKIPGSAPGLVTFDAASCLTQTCDKLNKSF